MAKDRLLHVLDVQEELNGELFFVAQCLEYDVRGIGDSVEEARGQFIRQIQRLRRRAELEGMNDPFAGIPAAAPRFWRMFKQYEKEGGAPEQPYW